MKPLIRNKNIYILALGVGIVIIVLAVLLILNTNSESSTEDEINKIDPLKSEGPNHEEEIANNESSTEDEVIKSENRKKEIAAITISAQIHNYLNKRNGLPPSGTDMQEESYDDGIRNNHTPTQAITEALPDYKLPYYGDVKITDQFDSEEEFIIRTAHLKDLKKTARTVNDKQIDVIFGLRCHNDTSNGNSTKIKKNELMTNVTHSYFQEHFGSAGPVTQIGRTFVIMWANEDEVNVRCMDNT